MVRSCYIYTISRNSKRQNMFCISLGRYIYFELEFKQMNDICRIHVRAFLGGRADYNRLRDLLRHRSHLPLFAVPQRMLVKLRENNSIFLPAKSSLCFVKILRNILNSQMYVLCLLKNTIVSNHTLIFAIYTPELWLCFYW